MKSNFLKVFASGAMAMTMLAGCGGSSTTTTNETADSGTVSDTVKIGLNYELSGNVADYGTKELKGSQLAIKQFNAREDKPFTVEGVSVDDKGEPAESVSAITKLVEQDGVVGVVGPATSGASIATYDFASSAAVPVISPSATQVDAMMKATGEPYEYAWRVCFEDSYQGKAMADYCVDELDCKKAVIFNEVSDYGQGLAAAFKEELEAKGGEVVDQVSYNSGDQNFSSHITKIKSMDFDVIYVAGYYNEAAQIIKAANQEGIDVPIVGADGFDSPDMLGQIGTELANNIFFTTAYTAVDPSDELKSFIDAYKAEYNEDPSMFSALAYDATNLLLAGLEATGKTGAELNEYIKNVNFSGITGSFSFDETNHTPVKSVLVVELVDGEQSNVKEVSAD